MPPPSTAANPYASPQTLEPLATDELPPHARALVDEVMAGTRYRTVPYVVSVLVMSFRRNLGEVHEVKTGEWPTAQLIQSVFLTGLFGWWGVPWGIAWTVQTLYYLWLGGRDHTLPILSQTIGTEQAKQVMKAAAKPKVPPIQWLVRLLVLLPIAGLVSLYLQIVL